MAWTATRSENFGCRHAESHGEEAGATLEALEAHRLTLESIFPRLPGSVTVVLHDSVAQLMLAQPWLALARRLSSPAGRRYMAGWFSRSEVHCLAPSVLRRSAASEESLEALLLTPQRYYTMLVVGNNNPLLPPPFKPAPTLRALRHAWRLEGAAAYFSGQVPFLRTAIAVRLRGRPVRLPPSARDAALLGGTLYDLLASERGERACLRLACHPDPADDRTVLEKAFGAPRYELTQVWRKHLERLSAPDPHVSALEV